MKAIRKKNCQAFHLELIEQYFMCYIYIMLHIWRYNWIIVNETITRARTMKWHVLHSIFYYGIIHSIIYRLSIWMFNAGARTHIHNIQWWTKFFIQIAFGSRHFILIFVYLFICCFFLQRTKQVQKVVVFVCLHWKLKIRTRIFVIQILYRMGKKTVKKKLANAFKCL